MAVKVCAKCQNSFFTRPEVDGKIRNLSRRKFCLDCSPFGVKNTVDLSLGPSQVSKIEKLSDDEFRNLINGSTSRQDVFRSLGMRASGGSYKILNRRIERNKFDVSHFGKWQEVPCPRKSNEDILCENSTYLSTSSLKRRLVKDGLMDYKCSLCPNIGHHNGKTLVLQLDHINGVRNDNRIENLRLLCPNCHSQTETFCGKRK